MIRYNYFHIKFPFQITDNMIKPTLIKAPSPFIHNLTVFVLIFFSNAKPELPEYETCSFGLRVNLFLQSFVPLQPFPLPSDNGFFVEVSFYIKFRSPIPYCQQRGMHDKRKMFPYGPHQKASPSAGHSLFLIRELSRVNKFTLGIQPDLCSIGKH